MNFYFHINWKHEDFLDYAKNNYGFNRSKKEIGDGITLEILNPKGNVGYVIWSRKLDYSIISHECLHATLMLFDRIDVKYSSDNSEQLCYYLEHLIKISTKKRGV
jgi:hypothetical protein